MSTLCFSVCPRTWNVQQSSEGNSDQLQLLHWVLSPQRPWQNATCVCVTVQLNRTLSAHCRLRSCRHESSHNMTVPRFGQNCDALHMLTRGLICKETVSLPSEPQFSVFMLLL